MLTRFWLRFLRVGLVVTVTLGLVVASAVPRSPFAMPAAQATTRTFASDGGVGVSSRAGNPYPSTIDVAGLSGTVLEMSVTLTGLRYDCDFIGASWESLDILLVGPGSQSVVLFSDVPRDANSGSVSLTFSDAAFVQVPADSSFSDGFYLPTDYQPGDVFPGPAPVGPHGSSLAPFQGATANGAWSLYVVSERITRGCSGGVTGWSLKITDGVTLSNATTMTFSGLGPADLYPSSIAVSGFTGKVNRVTVGLNGITHAYPGDLDILLVNPAGVGVVIMSDAIGPSDTNNLTLVLDDAATYFLPIDTIPPSGRYKPTNYNPFGALPDEYPAPAPGGPYGNTLASFRGSEPNGVWSLYAHDSRSKDNGTINGWSLTLETDSAPPVTRTTVAPVPSASGWVNANALVTLTGDDQDGSGVRSITYRASGAHTIPDTAVFTDVVPLSLTQQGVTTLSFFATDNVGQVEGTKTRVVRIDKTPPTATRPVQTLATSILSSNVRVILNWSGRDALSGVARYELQRSQNAGAFTNVPLPAAGAKQATLTLAPGVYQFRVRSIDRAGNASAFALGPSFRVGAYEEQTVCSATVTINCITYINGSQGQTWSQRTLSGAHGGGISGERRHGGEGALPVQR